FPITYVLGDVISEVYGWGVAMRVVWFGLLSEAIFAVCIILVIHLPSYGIGHYQNEYNDILGNIWLFVIAGIIADSIAGLLNIYIISRYKVRWEGK
ncbi:VUT family protein, partial [Acinetobacter baumannii]